MVAMMRVSVQLLTKAFGTVPGLVPKFVPIMVTSVPTGPKVGEVLLTVGGGGVTVNRILTVCPPIVTTRGPVVAAAGTVVSIRPAVQFVGVAGTPLNVTVLVPWAAPNPEP